MSLIPVTTPSVPGKAPILIIGVDIGNGKNDTLFIYENDIPIEVAQAFSKKHQLSKSIERLLVNQIEIQVKQMIKEQESAGASDYFKESKEGNSKNSNSKRNQHTRAFSSGDVFENQLKAYDRNNCGERLYLLGVLNEQQKERERAVIKFHRETAELREYTFTPSINQISNVLAKQFSQNAALRKEKTQRDKERQLSERIAREQENCTHTPQLSCKSRELVSHKEKAPISPFASLYNDAQSRREKQEDNTEAYFRSNYAFRPTIKSNHNATPQTEPNRLYNRRQVSDIKLQSQRSNVLSNIDPVTGQDYYKPAIGRPPKVRKSSARNVNSPQKVENSSGLEGKNQSERILMKRRTKKALEIFQLLGPNDSGNLIHTELNTDLVDPSVLKIIAPLIKEIGYVQQPISFEEFVPAIEALMKSLSSEQRRILLRKKKKAIEVPQETAKPVCSSTAGIYERTVLRKVSNQRKLKEERERKKVMELEECTFKPKTRKYRKVSTYY